MMCDWKSILDVLPSTIKIPLRNQDPSTIQEIRLRLGKPMQLKMTGSDTDTECIVTREDITYIINAASRYSPWQAQSVSKGFLSVPGGHRIGLCGQAILVNGAVTGIRDPDSLCIRIARDIHGLGKLFYELEDSTLIIGAPGWGKTTLLRDLARNMADHRTTVVLDERGELFPEGYSRGKQMDVLCNCPKNVGLEMVLRTMGPEVIALDEITQEEDCKAMIHASHCGVDLLATAHAFSVDDLKNRSIYRKLLESHIFQNVLVLRKDKSCSLERICEWN